MATSKKSIRLVNIGRSGNDSIAIALAKNATMTITPKEGTRGVLTITDENGLFFEIKNLSGYSSGEYKTIRDFDPDIYDGLEHISGVFYVAKATSDSAKGGACGSQWKRDADKFSLVARYTAGRKVNVEMVGNTFEVRADDKLLAVISAFGISSTRLDSWLGDSCPIGKHGKLSATDRLKLDIARQQKTVETQRANLESSEQVLADLLAKLPKKEREALTA
tara:strand:- start:389 stop:1051 length:663 start_codon:yes stop_codon:yes gene_type:complete